MADGTKRVIDQTTDSSLSAGDYVIVDNESEGTRKFDLGTELTDIKQDLKSTTESEYNFIKYLNADLSLVWEQGGLSSQTGAEYSANGSIRTQFYPIDALDPIEITNELESSVYTEWGYWVYDASKTAVKRVRSTTATIESLFNTQYKFIRFFVANWTTNTMPVSAGDSIIAHGRLQLLNSIKNRVEQNEQSIFSSETDLCIDWEQGGLNSQAGAEFSAQGSIRSEYIDIKNINKFVITNSIDSTVYSQWGIWTYDSEKTGITRISGSSETIQYTKRDSTVRYFRIYIANWNTDKMPLLESENVSVHAKLYTGAEFLDDELFAYSDSRLFTNGVVWRNRQYTLPYTDSSTYTADVGDSLTLSKDTLYTLYIGRLIAPSTGRLRLLIQYSDNTTGRYDVSADSRIFTFRTKNVNISQAKIVYVAVNGTAAGAAGTAMYFDCVLLAGVPQVNPIFASTQDAIPSYYMSHLLNKEATIRGHERNCSFNGEAFIFFTDPHFSYDYLVNDNVSSNEVNTNHSIGLMNHIIQYTGVRMVLFGGDLLNTAYGIDDLVRSCHAFYAKMKDFRFRMMSAVGNHEYYTDLQNPDFGRPTPDELYGALIKLNETDVISKGPMDTYCFDNTVQKIRYVIVSCGRDTELTVEQVKWVLNALLETPAGYRIIVMGHAFILDNMSGFRAYHLNIMQGLDAIRAGTSYTFDGIIYDYSALTDVSVVCVITGHTHIDGYLISEGDTLCIYTTCDCWSRAGEVQDGSVVTVPRPTGGIDEQAFDVMQFDFTNKRIYCTRIGAGSDRVFDYDPDSDSFGEVQ